MVPVSGRQQMIAAASFVVFLSCVLGLAYLFGQLAGWSLMRIVGILILMFSLPVAGLLTIWKMKKLALVFWTLAVGEALWLLYDFGILRF